MIEACPRSHQFRVVATALLVAASFCISPAAHAAKSSKVLVLTLQSDDLDDSARSSATEKIRQAVAKYPKIRLLETPKTDFFELMMEAECTDIDVACLVGIGSKFGADRVIFIEAAKAGDKLKVKLRYIDVAKGKAIKEKEGSAADVAALGGSVGGLLVSALGPLPTPKPRVKAKPTPPPKPKRVQVTLTANVAGTVVFLNNKRVGKTPLTRALKPGLYRIRFVKKGYQTGKRDLRVGYKKLTVNFSLRPVPKKASARPVTPTPAKTPAKPPKIERDGPFYTQWWFWTAVGVGVAGIATTAVLLSIDDTPVSHGVVNFGVAAPDYDPLVLGVQ